MELTTVTLANTDYPVRVGGQPKSPAVLLITDAGESAASYDAVAERLHNSGLRTFTVTSDGRMDGEQASALLDHLNVQWAHLVGVGAGGAIAWRVAAHYFGRAASLTVVDSAHPSVAGPAAGEPPCPPVEVATTVIITHPANAPMANGSARYVHSDFRTVELFGMDPIAQKAPSALAIEVVLRTSAW